MCASPLIDVIVLLLNGGELEGAKPPHIAKKMIYLETLLHGHYKVYTMISFIIIVCLNFYQDINISLTGI